jgi:glycosyltransferase involved in cell wall biosynthesis
MSDKPTLFDLSHFVRQPLRTGVQRVCHEIIARWPPGKRLQPACIRDDGRLYVLPEAFFARYLAFFQAPADELPALTAAIIADARQSATRLPRRHWRAYGSFIRAEALFDPPRLDFTAKACAAGYGSWLRWFVYDLLPWTYPQFFSPGAAGAMYDFLRVLRRLPHVAFDSVETRRDYERVVPDGPGGPVVQLGADGLGMAPPAFDPMSRRFAVIGTIEPRKNHTLVLDAFAELWAANVAVELVFAGSMGWVAEEVRQRIDRLTVTQPKFRWMRSIADAELVTLIRSCRATIYPALCEGYGLPPVESLALGVPVIVGAALPSIAMLEPGGQERLAMLDSAHVRAAVLRLLDNAHASQRYDQLRALPLPRWSDFATQFTAWATAPG